MIRAAAVMALAIVVHHWFKGEELITFNREPLRKP
jgi:hypothetical protein